MKKTLLVTDLTRMKPPRVCVAGYWEDLTLVRPKLQNEHGLTEQFLFQGGRPIIKPFAQVVLDFLAQPLLQPPHTEDWLIDPNFKTLLQEQLPERQRFAFLRKILDPDVASIFGTEIRDDYGFYVRAGEGSRSLGTIQPREINLVSYGPRENSNWDYRISFVDQSGKNYRLAVTDLAFRRYCDYRRQHGQSPEEIREELKQQWSQATVFFRIGLARGWEKFPDRCYLQITGIYTFPDYLTGQCFADFDLDEKSSF